MNNEQLPGESQLPSQLLCLEKLHNFKKKNLKTKVRSDTHYYTLVTGGTLIQILTKLAFPLGFD